MVPGSNQTDVACHSVMKGQGSSFPVDLRSPGGAFSLRQDGGLLHAANSSTHNRINLSLRLLFTIVWHGIHGVNASSLLHFYDPSLRLLHSHRCF